MNQGPSQIGRTLSGRYQIEELLGRGGMSTMYKARDISLKRDVAVEMLDLQLSADADFVRRFERELTAVAQLRHPNIAKVFDFNHDGGVYYIVREYIAGETLERRLATQRQLPLETALELTLNISNALAYAHARGQLHRDIRPANIVLEKQQAVLADFGLVKALGHHAGTFTGATVGTVGYMSPEVIEGEPADTRSDIYSLGVTLYEMLAGRQPFEADSSLALMMKQLHEPVPDLRGLRPNVPPTLVRLVERCLSKDPRERYESASELSADLRRVQAQLHLPTSVDAGSMPDSEITGTHPMYDVGKSASPLEDDVTSRPVLASSKRSWLKAIFEFFIGDRTVRSQRPKPPTTKIESRTPSRPVPPTASDKPSDQPVDEVSFTAYHPKEGRVDTWYSLLVYAHVASALVSVRQDAHKFDEQLKPRREMTSRASVPIARGTQITIIPTCNGITFNPERITFAWTESYHRADFRFKADPSLVDAAANGQISIHAGPLIIGTLKFALLCNESGTPSLAEKEERARMYLSNRIFISYSHKDADFALVFRNVLRALGYEVLIDIDDLRAGQEWNEELMRMIERADIFQLFWSSNSSQSEYCRREWEHALKQNKPAGFIRPIYWQKPLPPPPDELSKLHFDYVELKTPLL